ncbi:MAG TPA: DinB family protein [Vicinamibacterales bacterium]|nr:DinB family protein [Vicinamibacterales bacterium]
MAMVANPYAIHVGTREPRDVIETTALELHRLAGRIGAARITAPRAPGKWSARDILCHLADCEIVFAFRLRQALAENHHVIQPFDQEKWAPPYASLDADAALATFEVVRRWNLALLDTVTPAQRAKPVMHPERGEMTFETIVETMAGHDLNHVKQLEAIADASRSG